MRNLFMSCYTLLLLLLVLGGTAVGQAQGDTAGAMKTVVAQGVGAGADHAKSRDEAILDAQRKAVEQALGLYIKSETLVENLTLVSDTITRESTGYVHAYKLLDEKYDAEKDLFYVTIKAEVSLQRLEAKLDTLYEKLKVAGNPRVIVALRGTASLDDPEGVANALTAALVEKGITVLDDDQIASVRQKDALRLIAQGNVDAKTVMLLQEKADLLITGKVSAGEVERVVNNPVTYSRKVTLDARIIRIDTAEVLGAKRATGVGAGFAIKETLEAAEDKAGAAFLANNQRTLLRAVLDPCKSYTVKIAGCSYAQLGKVDSKLNASRFVRPTTDARFEDGYGVITVAFTDNAKTLATHLETAEGIKLKVVSVTGLTVMVKVQGE